MNIKKQKRQKSVLQKEILSSELIKASWIVNIINYLERKEIDVDCLKEDKIRIHKK